MPIDWGILQLKSLNQRVRETKPTWNKPQINLPGFGQPAAPVQPSEPPVSEPSVVSKFEPAPVPVPEPASQGVSDISLKEKLKLRQVTNATGFGFAVSAPVDYSDDDDDLDDGSEPLDESAYFDSESEDDDDGLIDDDDDDDNYIVEEEQDDDDAVALNTPMAFGSGYTEERPEDDLDISAEKPVMPRELVFDTMPLRRELHIMKPLPGEPAKPVQIRNFPRELMDLVKAQFSVQGSSTNMLAAFVYVKLGQACPLSDSILEQAKSFQGDVIVETLSRTMARMDERLRKQDALIRELELALGWLLYDKMGFRPPTPVDPKSAEIYMDGISDLLDRLRTESRRKEQQDLIKQGRAGRKS